jgi:hypothetical protein
MQTGETFIVTFPAGFDLTSLQNEDFDLATSSVDQTIATSSAAGVWGITRSGQTVTFETPTDFGVPSSTPVTVEIGSNASFGATGVNQITNPTVGSYEITITGSMQDSGATRVAIVDNVVVSAQVSTSFDFTVTGLATSTSVNGTTTTASSSPTVIAFSTLSAGVVETLAQQLTVTTNAANGFTVTVAQDHDLLSSTGADINGFIDGAYTSSPAAWQSPSASPSDDQTWGHWGLTSEDGYPSDQWVSASTTPVTVFDHNSVVSASTTVVGYQAEVSALQEAGDDYTATLTYVATPSF